MDELYFKQYSRYVKQNADAKSAMNLFLTLKKCRKSCYIHIHHRYEKSFLQILRYYKMKYETYNEGNISYFILSKNRISEEVKNAFHNKEYDLKNPHIMGAFLEYPAFINVRKVSSMKEIGSIQFYFTKDRKEASRELIYGFRIPNAEITPQMMTKMNIRMKKYQKCIQKYLGTLFPQFSIETSIKLNRD